MDADSHGPLLIVAITVDLSPLTRVMQRLVRLHLVVHYVLVVKRPDTCSNHQQVHINVQVAWLPYSPVYPRPILQRRLLSPEFGF